jgi:hypothetical protein
LINEKKLSYTGFASIINVSHGETAGLRTTCKNEAKAIKNPIQYAHYRLKKISPLGWFQIKTPSD